MASSSDTALKTFSLANDIIEIPPQDEIYRYDPEANKRLMREQPWTSE
jgi:COP9 signalosome complex subunit 5